MALVLTRSSTGFAETVARVREGVERRGLTLFAEVDHAAGAREAGLELDAETVLLLGNPRAGTLLMQADPRVGIELPLRILVWRAGSEVTLAYRDPHELAGDYDVGHAETLDAMAKLLAELAAEAAS